MSKREARIARISEPGAVFGELAVLLDQPHTADVRAVERSEFSVADAADFAGKRSDRRRFTSRPFSLVDLTPRTVALVEVKRQLETGKPHVAVVRTVDKIAQLLSDAVDRQRRMLSSPGYVKAAE